MLHRSCQAGGHHRSTGHRVTHSTSVNSTSVTPLSPPPPPSLHSFELRTVTASALARRGTETCH